MRAIKLPKDDEMREALDVREPQLKLGQNLEHTIGLVFGQDPWELRPRSYTDYSQIQSAAQ
jgi:hypothetical protein